MKDALIDNHQPLQITHILPCLATGGAERVAVDLANDAVRKGHKVSMIVGWRLEKLIMKEKLSKRIQVDYISKNEAPKIILYLKGFFWVLLNNHRLQSSNVVHAHLTFASIISSWMWVLNYFSKRRPIFVETYHAVGMNISKLLEFVHSQSFKCKDAVVFMAEHERWAKFTQNLSRTKVFKIIKNGVDADIGLVSKQKVDEFLSGLSVADRSAFVIGNVGQFRPDRSPTRVVQLFIEVLKSTKRDLLIIMCGEGSELESVKKQVTRSGFIDKFIFPGVVEKPQIPMSSMNLYLSLNIGEITGIAGIEAAFTGIPIVALQLDEKFSPSEDDWIWSSCKDSEVVAKLVNLIDRENELRELQKKQNAHALKNYSISVMTNRYFQTYHEALDLVSKKYKNKH